MAKLWLNGNLILNSSNQFVSHLIELEVWKPGVNNLTIKFTSPVNYALQQSEKYTVCFPMSVLVIFF